MAQLEGEELASDELLQEIQNIAQSIRDLNELFQVSIEEVIAARILKISCRACPQWWSNKAQS